MNNIAKYSFLVAMLVLTTNTLKANIGTDSLTRSILIHDLQDNEEYIKQVTTVSDGTNKLINIDGVERVIYFDGTDIHELDSEGDIILSKHSRETEELRKDLREDYCSVIDHDHEPFSEEKIISSGRTHKKLMNITIAEGIQEIIDERYSINKDRLAFPLVLELTPGFVQEFDDKKQMVEDLIFFIEGVDLLYEQIELNVDLMKIRINDPNDYVYTEGTLRNLYSELRNYWREVDFYRGGVMLLHNETSGGIAGRAQQDGGFSLGANVGVAVSGIRNPAERLIEGRWGYHLVGHELGHLKSAIHTHNCQFPDGKLDDYGSAEWGPCEIDSQNWNEGGSVMSYNNTFPLGFHHYNAKLMQMRAKIKYEEHYNKKYEKIELPRYRVSINTENNQRDLYPYSKNLRRFIGFKPIHDPNNVYITRTAFGLNRRDGRTIFGYPHFQLSTMYKAILRDYQWNTSLIKAFRANGRVAKSDGTGVEGVNMDMYGQRAGHADVRTDESGYISSYLHRLNGRRMISGHYTILPMKSGYRFEPNVYEFSIKDENYDDLEIKAIPVPGRLSIATQVRDINGYGVQGAVARLVGEGRTYETTTNSGGYFILDDIEPGSYDWEIEYQGYDISGLPRSFEREEGAWHTSAFIVEAEVTKPGIPEIYRLETNFESGNEKMYTEFIHPQHSDYSVIEISKDSIFNSIIETSEVKNSYYESGALDDTTKYYVRVKGVNAKGAGEWSETWSFTTMEEEDERIAVWPGDTNYDGEVNGADLLPIGTYYGEELDEENNPGTSWEPHERQPWPADGDEPARVYADANGDGIIDARDVLVLGLNYGKTWDSTDFDQVDILASTAAASADLSASESDAEQDGKLLIELLEDAHEQGRLHLAVDGGAPDKYMYGLSLKICVEADSEMALSGYELHEQTSELGEDLLVFSKQPEQTHFVDIALSNTAGDGFSGTGRMLELDVMHEASPGDQVVIHLQDVQAISSDGSPIVLQADSVSYTIGQDMITGMAPDETPDSYKLSRNYPNPFNPETQISYGLPQSEHVRLDVYDALGRHVTTLVNTHKDAGYHTVSFDASHLSSGMYVYRIVAGEFTKTRTMMLVK